MWQSFSAISLLVYFGNQATMMMRGYTISRLSSWRTSCTWPFAHPDDSIDDAGHIGQLHQQSEENKKQLFKYCYQILQVQRKCIARTNKLELHWQSLPPTELMTATFIESLRAFNPMGRSESDLAHSRFQFIRFGQNTFRMCPNSLYNPYIYFF